MIWNEQFVWLHMPKTGGTTMSRIFRNIDDSTLNIDDNSKDKKHDSEYDRKKRDNTWNIGIRRRIINIRRLSSWLISDWKHKREHMQLPNLSFEPVKCGLFYSIKLGGVWVTADYWLKYFKIDEQTQILRLEYLENDFKKYIYPLTKPRNNTIEFNRKDNSIELHEKQAKLYNITNQSDLNTIYRNNPYWAEIEDRLY